MVDPDEHGLCIGIRITDIAASPTELELVLAEPLSCPACGYTGVRWVVPAGQGTLRHRHGDPGEP